MIQTHITANADLNELWDEVIQKNEPLVLHQKGRKSVVLIDADELSGLMESAYLLRSPANAQRLFAALQEAEQHDIQPVSFEALSSEIKEALNG